MKPDHTNELEQRLSRLYAAPVPERFETGWRADIRREESIQSMKNWNGKRIWKRLVPALCALVLVLGGLWAGELDGSVKMNGADYVNSTVSTSRSSGSTNEAEMSPKYSLMNEGAFDETAVDYDMGISTYGAVQQTDRKLVRTVSLSIRTDVFDAALDQVQTTISEMGGYIENLYQYGESTRYISLSIRVPSERLDAFLQSMEGTGKVTDRSESTTDMTTQYVDNETRLKTLYEKRDRLNELLLKAENVSDLIEIESAIADTQYQIDSYETSQRSIDRQVDMSEVNLTLMEQEKTAVNPELTLGERIRSGFINSISWLEEMARNIVVFVVMASPVIGVIAVVWLGWKIVKKLRKRGD